jgi:hypothetical protein
MCVLHVLLSHTLWLVALMFFGKEHSNYSHDALHSALHPAPCCFLSFHSIILRRSRSVSVSTATGYELDGRGIWVRFQAQATDFCLSHSVQTNSGAHPASYTVQKEGPLYLGFKRPEGEADIFLVLRSRMVYFYFPSSIYIHGIVFNFLIN